jgi:hypothetical protein
MNAFPGSVTSSPRKKNTKRETTSRVPNKDATTSHRPPTSTLSDENGYSVGTRTRVRNGEVEVRRKGSTKGRLQTTSPRSSLEDTSIPQEAAEVPTPTAVDKANYQDAVKKNIDALLLGDLAAIASILPSISIKSPANHSDRPGTFDCFKIKRARSFPKLGRSSTAYSLR